MKKCTGKTKNERVSFIRCARMCDIRKQTKNIYKKRIQAIVTATSHQVSIAPVPSASAASDSVTSVISVASVRPDADDSADDGRVPLVETEPREEGRRGEVGSRGRASDSAAPERLRKTSKNTMQNDATQTLLQEIMVTQPKPWKSLQHEDCLKTTRTILISRSRRSRSRSRRSRRHRLAP